MNEENIKQKKSHKLRNALITISILIYVTFAATGLGLLVFKVILPGMRPISIETVKNSVVMVNVYDHNGDILGQGSGFCYIQDNWLITNFHVIEGADRIEILTDDDKTYEINKILIFDKKNDLAILEGDFKLNPVETISSFSMDEEDMIKTISSPGGDFNKITKGEIIEVYQDSMEMNVSISPGSSGGAVLNDMGRVIGVIVANLDIENNINLAINIDMANALYKKYEDKKYGVVNSSEADYESFMPDIFDNEDGNELEITDIWNKDKYKVYQPDSIETFSDLTSSYKIFDRIMSERNGGFSKIYFGLDRKRKDSVIDYYQYLRSYDKWWFSEFNDEFDETENLMKEKPADWEEEQVILDLKVLDRSELAILGGAVEDLIYYEDFEAFVNKLPIKRAEKSIILLVLGGITPRYLTRTENKEVDAYVRNVMARNDEVSLEDVLARLGY